jgi:nucleoside-triphosphatase
MTYSLLPSTFLAEWGHSDKRLLFLLTGDSGAGKTTWCMELAQEAAAQGWTVSGLCSPAVFEHGHKAGIDVIDLHSSRRRSLARQRGGAESDLTTLQWEFDERALAWANSLLWPEEHELLILDELGPMEFDRGRGFMKAFDLLDKSLFKLACVVVRPSLLLRAQDRWPQARLLDISEGRE